MKRPNHLASETSPYLLQHAYNPVDWYPWSNEALQKAQAENKPVLVSIGYSACHWCHVMEKESFENEETAAIMNQYFINIKIDREERPDLDQVYMDAVQAITGSGGWPLNVFLMPDGKPFYGGTYFPPQPLHNRPSWTDVLYGVINAYYNKKEEIVQQAAGLTEYITKSNLFGQNTSQAVKFTDNTAVEIYNNIMQQADIIEGGFGKAPKFPQTFSIQYLLRYYHFYKDENALQQAELSLQKMIYGGIFDQLGGGFARYSTDREWLVPHFEKMLYDNALLVTVLSDAYRLTKKTVYRKVIEQTMRFVQQELLSFENGFYSALDADSEGKEGKYYVWSKKEVEEILGDDATLFCAYYDITVNGNLDGRNILRIKDPAFHFVKNEWKNVNIEVLEELVESCREKLRSKREERIRPATDDKVLLSWNALMNSACSHAYAATGNEAYRDLAVANMKFLLQAFDKKTGLMHTYKNGQAKIFGFLDDYAFLIQALINLQEVTGQADYLLKARELTEYVIANFSDEENKLFYFTNSSQKDIIVRKKEIYDGAIPSANAVMVTNLRYMSIVFNDSSWRQRSEEAAQILEKLCINYPTSFGVWCGAVLEIIRGTKEIVLTGSYIDDLRKEILTEYIPFMVFQSAKREISGFPLLAGKAIFEQPRVYYCNNYSCSEPVNSLELLLKLL